jgi:hypothetical protein
VQFELVIARNPTRTEPGDAVGHPRSAGTQAIQQEGFCLMFGGPNVTDQWGCPKDLSKGEPAIFHALIIGTPIYSARCPLGLTEIAEWP